MTIGLGTWPSSNGAVAFPTSNEIQTTASCTLELLMAHTLILDYCVTLKSRTQNFTCGNVNFNRQKRKIFIVIRKKFVFKIHKYKVLYISVKK